MEEGRGAVGGGGFGGGRVGGGGLKLAEFVKLLLGKTINCYS